MVLKDARGVMPHRLFLPILVAVLCAVCFPAEPVRADAGTLPLRVRAIPLNTEAADETRVGPLDYRGGLVISSSADGFGGLSSLLVSADGARLLATSDRGHWFSAELRYDAAGRLVGLEAPRLAPMRDPRGRRPRAHARDAESLERLSDGTILVGFERIHSILSYAVGAHPLPDAERLGSLGATGMISFPRGHFAEQNAGLEALVALGDGRVLAIAEGPDGKTPSPAWLVSPDGTREHLTYARSRKFRPTGATRLPDGSILVLERRFTLLGGVAARLRRFEAADIVPGARLQGEEVASLRAPLSIDNMEGIAARRGAHGETLVYMISDDNYNIIQRTVLLMFALEDAPPSVGTE